MAQKGFVVYGDIEAVVSELEADKIAELFKGMLAYFNHGTDPGFEGVLKFVWIPIKQQMDRDRDKYEKKCERMQKNAEARWKEKQSHEADANRSDSMQVERNTNTKTKTKTNTDTDTNTNTMADETAESLSLSLIKKLNNESGARFRPTADFVSRIRELLGAGYTKADMMRVIEAKVLEWKDDPKMRGYLRPKTLFGDKFEDYVLAPVPIDVQEKEARESEISELEKELRKIQVDIAVLEEQVSQVRCGRALGFGGKDLEGLELEKAVKEQRAEWIDKRLERLRE